VKTKSFLILLLTILLFGCGIDNDNNKSSVVQLDNGYSLQIDTIPINVQGRMTHALNYQNKTYILFEQILLKYGGYGKRWLYVLSNGQFNKVADCPKEIESTYLDFYVKNNKLVIKPYMNMPSFYFDLKTRKWNKLDDTELDDLIFEDEKFLVYSLDFGEWGGKTWFKEKKTGQEYIINVTTPLVNKIDSSYYLTNSFKVIKIDNPLLLDKCSPDITYENIEATNEYYGHTLKSREFNVIYEDTTFNEYGYKYIPHIISSYVNDNQLRHIYEIDSAVYLATNNRNSIAPFQKIIENVSFYNWYFSYRLKNQNGQNELLKFSTKNDQLFGLLELNEKEIQVTYFKNAGQLEPKIIGTKKAEGIFDKRLNTILSDFNNTKMSQISLKEKDWGSFDITPNHIVGIGRSWNPNKYLIDEFKSFRVKEDSVFSNSIMYFGTKKRDKIRAVIIEWENEKSSENKFRNERHIKVNSLIKTITRKIGIPKNHKKEKSKLLVTWETPTGLLLDFSYSDEFYGIKLVVYEKKVDL
jgi:hypothetical protein